MCGIAEWAGFERDLAAHRATSETMACQSPDAAGAWCPARALRGGRWS
jgi:hypothetical protein